MLIEVARQKGGYVPDLSFGTHFFQDLVESSIRYLPLYPDEPGVIFNELFFRARPTCSPTLLPEFARPGAPSCASSTCREATEGLVLKVLMNGDLDEAVGVLGAPARPPSRSARTPPPGPRPEGAEDHWRWRLRMAQQIAAQLDGERFGVRAIYVFGSAKNATAGPGSDIDLLVHLVDRAEGHGELEVWLDGWSRALAEMNYLRTGYRSEGLLDVHYVTDDDIARGDELRGQDRRGHRRRPPAAAGRAATA